MVSSVKQVVLSRKFFDARYAKLAAVHGVLARSMVMPMLPWSVASVITCVPLVGMPSVGG